MKNTDNKIEVKIQNLKKKNKLIIFLCMKLTSVIMPLAIFTMLVSVASVDVAANYIILMSFYTAFLPVLTFGMQTILLRKTLKTRLSRSELVASVLITLVISAAISLVLSHIGKYFSVFLDWKAVLLITLWFSSSAANVLGSEIYKAKRNFIMMQIASGYAANFGFIVFLIWCSSLQISLELSSLLKVMAVLHFGTFVFSFRVIFSTYDFIKIKNTKSYMVRTLQVHFKRAYKLVLSGLLLSLTASIDIWTINLIFESQYTIEYGIIQKLTSLIVAPLVFAQFFLPQEFAFGSKKDIEIAKSVMGVILYAALAIFFSGLLYLNLTRIHAEVSNFMLFSYLVLGMASLVNVYYGPCGGILALRNKQKTLMLNAVVSSIMVVISVVVVLVVAKNEFFFVLLIACSISIRNYKNGKDALMTLNINKMSSTSFKIIKSDVKTALGRISHARKRI